LPTDQVIGPVVVLTVRRRRTCARCGQAFDAVGREYTCTTCREARIDKSFPRKLSFRESQIVALVREAKANKQIAFELGLTQGTVKEYLYHIFRKLGVSNRTELALWSGESQECEAPLEYCSIEPVA